MYSSKRVLYQAFALLPTLMLSLPSEALYCAADNLTSCCVLQLYCQCNSFKLRGCMLAILTSSTRMPVCRSFSSWLAAEACSYVLLQLAKQVVMHARKKHWPDAGLRQRHAITALMQSSLVASRRIGSHACKTQALIECARLSEPGFDPGTCGLWAHHASAAPLRNFNGIQRNPDTYIA